MIIQYSLIVSDFDSVSSTLVQTWQYQIPHSTMILGTFTGTEAQLQLFLRDSYTI